MASAPTQSQLISEEDVIKRRLLMDGDGTGDDRRINILLKKFIKWCRSKESLDESRAAQDQLFGIIGQCEYAYLKSCIVRRKSLQELNNYKLLSYQIKENIERAKEEIVGIKEEFEEAKKIRKNRLEYEELAKVIENHPHRRETNEKVAGLHLELKILEEKEAQLARRVDLRRKQFQVMVTTLQMLKSFLDTEDEDEASQPFVYDDLDDTGPSTKQAIFDDSSPMDLT